MVETLINEGAVVDAKNAHNRTPLHFAASSGYSLNFTIKKEQF